MLCLKTLNRLPNLNGTSSLVRTKFSPCYQKQVVRTFRQRPKAREGTAKHLESFEKPNIPEAVKLDFSPNGAGLLKPFLFSVASTGVVFTGCALWQYEKMRSMAVKITHGVKYDQRNEVYQKANIYRRLLYEKWSKLIENKPHNQLTYGIIGANAMVFLCWRFPPLRSVMTRYFLASPFGKAPCLSLIGATFSHTAFIHLFVNMYVLSSFVPSVVKTLGIEQATAFYVSAGIWSTLASHALKIATKSPAPSVGASGAILGMLAAVCYQFPDARLSFAGVDLLVPHSFSAQQGLTGIMIFDALGILLRWRFFDHAGHLGGVVFGLVYMIYGHQLLWGMRSPVVEQWHKFRGDIPR